MICCCVKRRPSGSGKVMCRVKVTLLFVVLYNLCTVYGQDVVGCGGFVKSHIQINYSLVNVKLYTKQGILKYQTDCAPHNGYYLIPLYDKGDYTLEVEPPTGWTFEPSSIDLHVDGKTDPCSKNRDINFIFKGFLISGKVVSTGLKDGPPGVSIALKSKTPGKDEQVTETVSGGMYKFDAVSPGEYVLEARHKTLKLAKEKVNINVVNDLLQVTPDFVISGYNVQGQVVSDQDPIKGVNFVLYSETVSQVDLKSCNRNIPKEFIGKANGKALCYVESNSDGLFLFSTLSPGSYNILPFYKGQNIRFEVKPQSLAFRVRHEDVILDEVFQVQGFSVSGRVLSKVNGQGVVNANVLVTSESNINVEPHQTKTSADGIFHLENMKAGMYKLTVTYPSGDLIFPSMSAKVTPNTPQLPDVVASGFKVCGKLIIRKTSHDPVMSISVDEKNAPSGANILTVDRNGEFCTVLKAGKYLVKPIAKNPVDQSSLKFDPPKMEVEISDRAKMDLIFTQYLSKIQGSVSCILACPVLQVVLKDSKNTLIDKKSIKNGQFIFADVLSGTYTLSLSQDNWCWKNDEISVVVASKDVNDVQFLQTGYLMTIWTSHDTKLIYKHNKDKQEGSINLVRGTNNHCFKKPGQFDLKVVSCHEFGEEKYLFDTAKPSVITFTAMKHQITGKLKVDTKANDIKVTVTPPDGKSYVVPVSAETSKGKSHIYSFMFSAYPNQVISLTPNSGTLLFYPEEAKITATDDCISDAVTFEGRKGLFINGLVNPPLEGVKITVKATDGSRMPIVLKTKADGKYDLGPLDSLTKYAVSAEKSGYVLKEISGKSGHFKAFKLAEIKVSVVDMNKQPLLGVLLSLTGGIDYRQNSVTGQDGKMTFSDLSPGQYFLKPMMKEYNFEPVSKMFNMTEGASLTFTIKAVRTAFSCFGKVTSLTGESEPGVSIEAVGIASALNDCSHLHEDAVSETDGSFRIRGLKPQCEFKLQLKQNPEVNKHIERSSPKYKIIKIGNDDLVDVKLMVFRHMQIMEITANIVTQEDFLHTFKVKLYKEENPDVAISTINVGTSSFFQLPSLPIDNSKYIIRLETSLPRNTYETDSMPQMYFEANTSFRHITIHFNPKPRLLDQETLGQGTLLMLPLTLLVIFIIYNHSKIVPVLTNANVFLQNITHNSRSSNDSSSVDSMAVGRRKLKVRKAL